MTTFCVIGVIYLLTLLYMSTVKVWFPLSDLLSDDYCQLNVPVVHLTGSSQLE
ncbi:MAG: hypothetical protein L0J63_12975 [Tetragenococcus koreensis]|nr:hypothetical protein [Tetragenococcus koreensis]